MPTGHYPRPSVQERLERQCIPEPNSGCWLWTGAIYASGYGGLQHKGRSQYAHRVSYEIFVGPIPNGHDIDHLCRLRLCVNPEYLQAVTRRENLLRSWRAAIATEEIKNAAQS